MKNMQNI